MRAVALLLLGTAATSIAATGCTPTCKEVCDKLVECEEVHTERMTSSECEESCKTQDALYAQWTDQELRDAFDDQLECLKGAECAEIADGVCYDETIWAYRAAR